MRRDIGRVPALRRHLDKRRLMSPYKRLEGRRAMPPSAGHRSFYARYSPRRCAGAHAETMAAAAAGQERRQARSAARRPSRRGNRLLRPDSRAGFGRLKRLIVGDSQMRLLARRIEAMKYLIYRAAGSLHTAGQGRKDFSRYQRPRRHHFMVSRRLRAARGANAAAADEASAAGRYVWRSAGSSSMRRRLRRRHRGRGVSAARRRRRPLRP